MKKTDELFNASRMMTWLMTVGICLVSLNITDAHDDTVSLKKARELGRLKSRFLKPGRADSKTIPKADVAFFKKSLSPVLTKSCLKCHGPDQSEGNLRIDQLDADLLNGSDVKWWREIYNVISNSEMPPDDEPDYALDDADRRRITDWLSAELNKASVVARQASEYSSFRRMTKYEYNYALQDLLGLKSELSQLLPPEATSEDGFKNSSSRLQMSAMQFQTYRETGLKALKRATVGPSRLPSVTYTISMKSEMEKTVAGNRAKPFDRNDKSYDKVKNRQHLLNWKTGKGVAFGGVKPQHQSTAKPSPIPDASPVVLVLPRSNELKLNLDRFLPDEGTMRVSIRASRSNMDAKEFASLRLEFGAHTSNDARFSEVISRRDQSVTAPSEKPQWLHFDIELADIQRNPFRKLDTPFPRRDEFLTIQNISNSRGGNEPLQVLIESIQITAPYYEQWPPKTHTDIFFASDQKSDEQKYGREVLTRFLNRTWRRPVGSEEVGRFMKLFDKYRPGFDTFEETMVEVLATALAAPEFLYLAQRSSSKPETKLKVNDFELASRLSFFLWSSIPDAELLKLAEQGKLHQTNVLRAQVERMLADPRSHRFAENFVSQWLGLDGLENATHIADGELKAAMREEPIALFETLLRDNGNVLDFLHADYAVVNERLAKHYGIRNVYGPQHRKVTVEPNSQRGGLMTSAAILAMNSDGKDSHPIKRGVWMLNRILHDPPPPPPPDVPEVDLTDPEILKMTLKERIADHRNKPACISCHARIDPWGIAFENYDARGVFRTRHNDKPVESTSTLFNKDELAGMNGLKQYLLLNRQDQFAKAMVEKLTAYGLGRPLSFSDYSDLDGITRKFRKQDDRLGDLIKLIVSSELFQQK